ncbi:hypothetical protein AVEN_53301-1 [Araneus ventricosus]|uniref:Uncharacterized protein n=1 Tax=Araneus ventricosus TaxID=182803 RepID=A0A4Y2AC95_ARAVE|nr:hypothetical protein AVEN_53301-1 [Araneus ventricosus]
MPDTHGGLGGLVGVKRPPDGALRKFGDGVPAQVSSSSSDCCTKLRGNQSIGQYLSVHKDSFSNPSINRRLEEAVVGDWPKMMKFKAL